ncbi:MAG TPA: 4a-hydroxytetrahydrobiopterin dehydratase [archaeon]|nr:4a-hydroxytetrahydrobiopterin dehydratase [archaeon]
MRYGKKQINEELKKLQGWKLKGKEIWKVFKFRTFIEAMWFVTRVAAVAENSNHHPDILIKYDTVQLNLTTHDEGRLTEKDFNLADKIEKLVK